MRVGILVRLPLILSFMQFSRISLKWKHSVRTTCGSRRIPAGRRAECAAALLSYVMHPQRGSEVNAALPPAPRGEAMRLQAAPRTGVATLEVGGVRGGLRALRVEQAASMRVFTPSRAARVPVDRAAAARTSPSSATCRLISCCSAATSSCNTSAAQHRCADSTRAPCRRDALICWQHPLRE